MRLNLWVKLRKSFLVDYNKLDFEKEMSDWSDKMKMFIKKSAFLGHSINQCAEIIADIETQQETMFEALDLAEEDQDNIKHCFEDYAKGKKNPQVLLNKIFKRKAEDIPLPEGDYDFDPNIDDFDPDNLHQDIYKEYFNFGFRCTLDDAEERNKMFGGRMSSPREQPVGLPKDVMKHLNQHGLQPSRGGAGSHQSRGSGDPMPKPDQYGAPPVPNQPSKSPIGTDRSDENMGYSGGFAIDDSNSGQKQKSRKSGHQDEGYKKKVTKKATQKSNESPKRANTRNDKESPKRGNTRNDKDSEVYQKEPTQKKASKKASKIPSKTSSKKSSKNNTARGNDQTYENDET